LAKNVVQKVNQPNYPNQFPTLGKVAPLIGWLVQSNHLNQEVERATMRPGFFDGGQVSQPCLQPQ